MTTVESQARTLSVLMPVYNEAKTLKSIIKSVLASPIDLEIELIAVDDCSTDRSLEILKELSAADTRIKVIEQPDNSGKGKAIRTAIEHMTGDIAIVQDADLEYDPREYPRVLAPIIDGRADAVFGSRFAASPERRVLLYWHSLGNRLLTWLANVLNDLNLTDMETCYKAVRSDILKSLRLRSDRFGIEPELTTRLAQWGARIYEVPISYHGRSYAEGKKIGWRDGVQAVGVLLRTRFLDTRFAERHGHTTLESLRSAKKLNRWMLAQFDGRIGQRVFEAGAGVGNLTELLLNAERLVAVDIDEFYVRDLERRFGRLDNTEILLGDLEEPSLYDKLADEGFDTVVSVNVLEHLDHPHEAVAGFERVLVDGGRAVVLVPAHSWLYSAADTALEHRLRYDEETLRSLFDEAGLHVVEIRQFNRLGVPGWWVNKLRRATGVSPLQARVYSLLIPLAKIIERLSLLPGLSLIVVAEKRK